MKIINSRPNIVVLDFDNTLYDYSQCHQPAQNKLELFLVETFGRPINEVTAALDVSKHNVKARLGSVAASHSRLLYVEQLCHDLKLGFQPEACLTAERMYWSTFLSFIKLRDGAEEFLLRLRQLNIKSVVVTDLTSDIQMRKVLKLRIPHLFDGFFTSEFLGEDKRATGLVSHLPLILGDLEPEVVWFVGDSEHDFPERPSESSPHPKFAVHQFKVPQTNFRQLLKYLDEN